MDTYCKVGNFVAKLPMSVVEFFKIVKRSILHDDSRCLTYFFSALSFLFVCFIIIGTVCDLCLNEKGRARFPKTV